MGERKGTNHYYPPDYDPKKGGLNKFLGTHALRERARKLHLGILIIRFEMPYNIWCGGCGNHIGMGVRYNAEKKKVGMYYSTPIYQFRMKCHLCDNHFEIKTDPANLDYVIVCGARRQENRWDPTENGQIVPEDKATSRRLFDDAMFKLEHGEEDKTVAKSVVHGSRKLISRRDEIWQDDFSANSALRAKFRASKRAVTEKDAKDKALLNKYALDMQLLPESESDVKMASLLSLTPTTSFNERKNLSRQAIINNPILPSTSNLPLKFMNNSKNVADIMKRDVAVRKKQSNNQSDSSGQLTHNMEYRQCKQVFSGILVNTVSSNAIPEKKCEANKGGEPSVASVQNDRMCDIDSTRVSLVSSLYSDSSSD